MCMVHGQGTLDGEDGYVLALWAAQGRQTECFQVLLAYGCGGPLDSAEVSEIAAQEGSLSCLQLALEAGYPLGDAPHCAASKGTSPACTPHPHPHLEH
jgi:hypothetical protein